MFMFSQLLYHELNAQSSKPSTSLSRSTSPPPPYQSADDDLNRAESSSSSHQPSTRASTLSLRLPSHPNLLRDQTLARDSVSNHAFVIQSTSSKLAHGFPHMVLPSHLLSSHVAQDDWSHFIDCVNAQIETSVSNNTRTYEEGNTAGDMKAYVAQWSVEFFEPRGLQITLRRSGDPIADTRADLSHSLTHSPSPSHPRSHSPTISVSQPITSLPLLSEPPDGWVSKKAAAARASGKQVDEKLEREREKHEAYIKAMARKAQKAAEKLERSARKQEAKARRREGKNSESTTRGDSRGADAMQLVDETDQRRWEIVIQSL